MRGEDGHTPLMTLVAEEKDKSRTKNMWNKFEWWNFVEQPKQKNEFDTAVKFLEFLSKNLFCFKNNFFRIFFAAILPFNKYPGYLYILRREKKSAIKIFNCHNVKR